MTALWRLAVAHGVRWAVGDRDAPSALLPADWSLDAFLSVPRRRRGLPDPVAPVPAGARVLVPLDGQPVWAAGVTFERSRQARKEEAPGTDVYDRVYEADRPELFVKALPGGCRGPGEEVTVRPDSVWDVPEPELGVLTDAAGEVAAWTLGDDVSSRSIEGENPLYLPQAKVWTGSCSAGPCLVLDLPPRDWSAWTISLSIDRDGRTLFADTVELRRMRRTPADLASWLHRYQSFPHGVLLLCGTSIVPEADVTLRPGDLVTISSPELGDLHNQVALAPGRQDAPQEVPA